MSKRVRVVTLLIALGWAALAQAQTFTTIYSFTGGKDGGIPIGGVIPDAHGNLYGTTQLGGELSCTSGDGRGCGTVFKIDSSGQETVLHSFKGGTTDGCDPVAGLFRDEFGNLYGTTSGCGADYGTVFKLDGDRHETVLHSFQGGPVDGMYPYGGVIGDRAGNLYGTTEFGGAFGDGTVFRISKSGKETVLLSFDSTDGAYPQSGKLVMDKTGNLFGVTTQGGEYGGGVVYRMSKRGKLTVLHSFGSGGDAPCELEGKPWVDDLGNIYGTSWDFICEGRGTVWKVTKTGTETTLYTFNGSDGEYPFAGVDRDEEGNLYGTTAQGGAYLDGVVFELSESGTLTLLHSFSGTDGANPYGGLLLDKKPLVVALTATGQCGSTYPEKSHPETWGQTGRSPFSGRVAHSKSPP